MQARRRALAALGLAVIGLLVPVACGSDGGSDPAAATGSAPPQDGAAPEPSPPPAPPPPAPRPAVRVAFRLDPVLTDGAYMGERWVSPRVFHAAAQTGPTFHVEARIEVPPAGAHAAWTPSDPAAVTVAPRHARRVEITVSRAGRSALTVSAGGESSTLTIDAAHEDGRWLVTFSE